MNIPKYNTDMKQGSSWALSFRYLDANGNAVDLTGYSAECELRDKMTNQLLETPAVGTLGSSGVVALTLTAAETQVIASKTAKYDVFLKKTGVVDRFIALQGDIEIEPSVTAVAP